MPVKFRITLLFSLLVTFILALVCGAVYYFADSSREQNVKNRLTNRAVTTARLLSYSESFTRAQVERIDSLTTLTLKNKSVIAFDHQGDTVYNYNETPSEKLHIPASVLEEARVNGTVYFRSGEREAVAYHYTDNNIRFVIIVAAVDQDGINNLNKLRNILILSFLSGLILTLTLGYTFSGRLLRPLQQINNEITEISAKNLKRRIPSGEVKDEWNHLTSTLNNLLDRLNESFELQKNFIANASHELSTPLTAVSGQLQVILQRERNAEEYKAVIRSVLEDLQNMAQMTRMLLEFTKASADQGSVPTDYVRIDETLMKMPATVAAADSKYRIKLNFEQLPDDERYLLVYGNEDLLFTALKNIVLNACKFSEDNTAVVTLQSSHESAVVRIFNTGERIDPQHVPYLFQPFYRGTDTKEGFGLGLSLANRILRLHDASLELNEQRTDGTEFIVSIPVAKF